MLSDFIKKYNYKLKNQLVFNSYRTGQRSEIRDYDSVSVTEILSLIEDPNLEMVKQFYPLEMKKAQENGTKTHKELEDYSNGKGLDKNNSIHIQFKKGCIIEGIRITSSEKVFKKNYKGLPTITGTIDAIGKVRNIKALIDYKTSSTKRNFRSVKYNLQMAGYRWLSKVNKSYVFYLNKNSYDFVELKDLEYWDSLWLELLNYASYLYNKGLYKDLYINK